MEATPELGKIAFRTPLSDDQAKLLLASAEKQSGASFYEIHPIVLLHIADHHHRNVAQHGGRSQIFGALLGHQDGSKMEINFAFELVMDVVDGKRVLDRAYWERKGEQFKQTLPQLDLIGWYTVDDDYLTPGDLELQWQFWDIIQNPLLLKVRPAKPASFPADLFESVMEFGDGPPSVKFIPSTYKLVFDQAEQIGLNHIATKSDSEASGSGGMESDFQLGMRSMSSAVRMLQEKVSMIVAYNNAVNEGTLPFNEDIMTEQKRIVELLDGLESEEQDEKFLIMKLQATMTAAVGGYSQATEGFLDFIKHNLVMERRSVPGMGKGISRARAEGLVLPGTSAGGQQKSKMMGGKMRFGRGNFSPNFFRKADKGEVKSGAEPGSQ